jgi:hypothetical protein
MGQPSTTVFTKDHPNGLCTYVALCTRHNFRREMLVKANAQALARCHDLMEHGKQRTLSQWARDFTMNQQAWSTRLRIKERG